MKISWDALVRMIDHALLRTDATPAQISALVTEARELGVFSVRISPSVLPLTDDLASLKVATVCGFPSGNHTPATKAAGIAKSSRSGADEIDIVINTGYLKTGGAHRVVEEITAVCEAITGLLKVIIESTALTDKKIATTCRAAEKAGADSVKISTGFYPADGTSTCAVALMTATVDGRLGIKVSSGIHDWATAQEMVVAEATRLELSASRAILEGAPA